MAEILMSVLHRLADGISANLCNKIQSLFKLVNEYINESIHYLISKLMILLFV